MNGASDGIVLVDSQGLIVVFNPAMETITGWPSEEAVGNDCDEITSHVRRCVPAVGARGRFRSET